jgi:hypothetical protein
MLVEHLMTNSVATYTRQDLLAGLYTQTITCEKFFTLMSAKLTILNWVRKKRPTLHVMDRILDSRGDRGDRYHLFDDRQCSPMVLSGGISNPATDLPKVWSECLWRSLAKIPGI